MQIRIIAVGKLKEAYFAAAAEEYTKRLGRFARVETVQIPDRRIPDRASAAQERQVLEQEGQDILAKIAPQDYVAALCVEGKKLDSPAFAQKLSALALSGKSTVTFVIGGSLGLSDAVKQRADFHLSFSDMTFPHQLMRVILLEQVYRAFKILANETYHK
ncbi:MAG TPA: 23S rRNA (pseudouridine(1915)-N(3))-methyltransferase RlmH [Candidatus Aphodoplasma excrementigallinarum]|uniref:Ribosomal RNA large subunit methyltransferase H n=1 Tax=Candidatus Aphodoplasma excrementigallinarum TaxID=2840673 RepID=A0A9D1T120_9FIRM|nr:23S rRNA (pseudouridine(1915)-N(3))-methyltransferase RlmH [Candidatus Aphodoplasma excrementigallinarum]